MTPRTLRLLTRPDAAQYIARPRITYSSRRDIKGIRFGRLVALEDAGVQLGPERGRCWRCVCDCGTLVVVRLRSLMSKNTRSCGCLKADVNRWRGPDQRHHFGGQANVLLQSGT